MVTWEELVELEPELMELEKLIRKRKPNTIKNWYAEYLPILIELVGYYRKKESEILETRQAYDVAYQYLINIVKEDSDLS